MNAKRSRTSLGGVGFGLMGVGCILLLLLYADGAVDAVKKGLQLCHNTVIPALFPFMVASEILVGCGAAAAIGRVLSRPLQAALGVPGAAGQPAIARLTFEQLCGQGSEEGALAHPCHHDHQTEEQVQRLPINRPSPRLRRGEEEGEPCRHHRNHGDDVGAQKGEKGVEA